MTKVKFFAKNAGFEITGHSSKNGNDEAGRIVCAAVSSAAYMAANTITEIVKDEALAQVDDAKMLLSVKSPSEKTAVVLAGLQLHLSELAKEYPRNIQVISEV